MNNKPVLSCSNLAKTYTDGASNVKVLSNINFTLHQSEMMAIIGSSGSGKSTLLHLLAGLDQPTAGEVNIVGKNIHHLSEREKCRLRNKVLGFVYQFHHLLPEFSALENVAMPLLIQGIPVKEMRERATMLLEHVGLKERLHHRLGQLSGGERQRVAIARALVTNPLCVLADEPTGNLDPTNAERVLQIFFDLQKINHTSVVLVTHDADVAKHAHFIKRIQDGELVDASITELGLA